MSWSGQLDRETHAQILELLAKGHSHRQVAKITGAAVSTVGKYRNRPLRELRYQGPGIRSDKKRGEFDWREWADKLTELQQLKRQGSHTQDHAFIELGDGTRPVALASFSDQHMGSWGCDYRALKSLTDELLGTPDLYIALLGDYGQYSIKLRSVLEVMDNALPPEQQTEFVDAWFRDIWHKVAFATWDNHAVERQEQLAGESSVKKLLSKKVVYFNGIGHVDLKVGNQLYKGVVTHKFRGRSLLNPTHGQMRYMRFEGHDRDWAMAGDSHVPGMAKYTDGDKVRVAINCGSLQTNSGFGKRYFSLTTHPVYPIIVFDPDKKEMTPFWSVKEWLKARGK